MKRNIIIFLVAIFTLLPAVSVNAGDVTSQTVQVNCSGGKKAVTLVRADLNDKSIQVEAAIAHNQIGTTDDLANIARQLASPHREVIAAINGTYFNAYDTYKIPWNAIQRQGVFLHTGTTGSVIGFTQDNHVRVEHLFVGIEGSLEGKWEWPYNWYAWGLNHMNDQKNSIIIYTPAYGKTTGAHKKTSIVVNQGVIVDIHYGAAPIYPDGFTIVTDDPQMLGRFKVGQQIEYRFNFSEINFSTMKAGAPVMWSDMRTTIGAGPMLVKNGNVVINPAGEGFLAPKILNNSGARSLAGATAGNQLIIGAVSAATVYQMAQIAKNLGLVNAICLDGGASSSLYYRGKYLTPPGRKLSNALVITRIK